MQRLIASILTAIAMLGIMLVHNVMASPAVIVEEDYDALSLGMALPNWVNIAGAGGSLPVVQNVSFSSAPQGAEITNDFAVERSFTPLSGKVTVEVWINPALNATANFILRLAAGEPGNPHRGGVSFVSRGLGNKWYYHLGNTPVAFADADGQGHDIKIIYNTAAAQYDLYFDGTLIGSELEMPFPSNPINGLAISGIIFNSDAGGTGYTSYFDDVKIAHEPLIPDTCTMRTSYDAGSCSGTFQAFSVADLSDYAASNFGRNGGADFAHLQIMSDLSDTILDIESPCKITLAHHVVLSGVFVSLDGRQGVNDGNGYTINADTACVLSEQDRAQLGAGSVVNAKNLTVQAKQTAEIGRSATVTLTESLTLISTGNDRSSNALIRSGSTVSAGAIALSAWRGAHLGESTAIRANTILLTSRGDTSGSYASVKAGAEVSGADLTIFAFREAKVGQNTTVTLTGDLIVDSTGNGSASHAILKPGARVSVGGGMALTSSNKASIERDTTVDVTGNLNMDAESPTKCTIRSSAHVSLGSKSGNCSPLLP